MYIYVCTYVSIYERMDVCMYVCMYVRMLVCNTGSIGFGACVCNDAENYSVCALPSN